MDRIDPPDHDLIHHGSAALEAVVAEFLARSKKAHFVLGHLFLPGLLPVIDRIRPLEALRCLIGNTTHAETPEQLLERHHRVEPVQGELERRHFVKRPELRRILRKGAEDLRESIALMDQTEETLRLLRTIAELIEKGTLTFRMYPRGRLSARAYLFEPDLNPSREGEAGAAILGTTNLTHARLTDPTEMNVVVRGRENHAELLGWFEELWNQSEDFGHAVADAIHNSWANDHVRPYDIYMKTLYSLLKDRMDDDASREVLWDDEIVSALADYQKLAVRQAVQKIRDHGGVFIADVVGLGKSFIGAAVLKQFERNELARGLIVCPAHLVPMWERYNEHYDLHARVLSMGMLRNGDGPSNILLDDDLFRHRDFVLIDESHNFRNSDTQRYRIMQQFLSLGKRCCFLTATPRNKSGWDIYNQIKLFHPADRTDLPIDPPDLREYFRLAERGERSLPDLLSHVLIRRTRNHIVKWYGYDSETDQPIDPGRYAEYRAGKRRCYVRIAGRKQFFPRRELATVHYSIEDTYSGIYQELRRSIGNPGPRGVLDELPEGLTLARYAIGRYLRPEKWDDARYARLKGATSNLHGLVRILLFKRLESSVHAFRETVRRLIDSHRAFMQAVEAGRIPTGEAVDHVVVELGDGDDILLDREGRATAQAYDIEDFLRNQLVRDLAHDLGILQRILELVAPIGPAQDAKLSVLKDMLEGSNLRGRKVLIFTQYTDTAEYLHGALNPGGDDLRVAVVHGNIPDYGRIVGRFAPRSNPALNIKRGGPEIMTLIATDVLSEGMNLQDCDSIINYDLHWNPVRLIQRFGRIDRIGTEFEIIRGFNFLPETGLERNLGLRQRLRQRIQEIHDTIGEDTAILDPAEQLNESAMYAIYEPGEGSEALFDPEEPGDLVDLGEAEEMLRLLRRENPEEFARIVGLADGIRSGKPDEEQATYVLCRAGRYHKAYLVDSRGEMVSSDLPRLLGRIQCGPELHPIALAPEHGRNVVAARRRFEEEVQNRALERDQTRTMGVGQRYVLHEFKRLLSEEQDEDSRARILLFDAAFRNSITNAVRRELNLLRRNGLSGAALLNELGRIYQDHRLRNQAGQEETDEEATPRVICSMTLR